MAMRTTGTEPFPRMLFFLMLFLVSGTAMALSVQVSVTGVQGEMRDNVLALLTIERNKDDPLLNAVRLRRDFTRGQQEIARALQPFGYYNPVIHAQLHQDGQVWNAQFAIDLGNPVRIKQVDMQLFGAGQADPQLQEKLAALRLPKDAIASQVRYEAAKKGLLNTALDLGYLDATYTAHELRIDPRNNQAQLTLHLDTGPRYRFGPVSFNDAGLDQSLLHKYVPFAPGDPYSGRKLLELQRALMDSDYFDYVTVTDDRGAAQNRQVPIHVQLTPRKRHKYTAGIGFGTDTGLRGKLGWEHRRINRQGHKLAVELSASEIHKGLTSRYTMPVGDPRTDRLVFTAADTQENTDTANSTVMTLGSSLYHARGKWRETLSLNYQDEDYTVGGQQGRSTLLMPGVAWSRVQADNALSPRRGTRLQLELRGAAQQILSDTSFVQLKAGVKRIMPVFKQGRLLVRLDIGTSWVSKFADLPPTVRFFAGGDQSVRGYDYETLGPKDSTGKVVGGRHLLVGSVEYEHQVQGPWRAAVFVDSGNAFDHVSAGTKTGIGIGVRRVLPIGMLRVDLAVAMSEPSHPIRLHISLGPDL